MAVKATIANITTPTSTGSTTHAHGHGTTPQAVLFVTSAATANETAEDHTRFGFGFSDATTNLSVTNKSEHNSATTDSDTRATNDKAIAIQNTGNSANDLEGNVTGFDATNVTVNYTSISASARLASMICFSGMDGVDVQYALLNGTTGVTVTHNLGLTTTNHALIISLSYYGCPTDFDGGGGDYELAIGLHHWNGTTFTERGLGFIEDNGEAQGQPGVIVDTGALPFLNTADYTLVRSVTLSNFATNSFEMVSDGTHTGGVAFLILGLGSGDEAWVDDIQAPTTRGTKAYTGVGFEPNFVGIIPTNAESLDSVRTSYGAATDGDEAVYGFGGMDGTTEGCVAVALEDNAATTDTQSTHSNGSVVYMPAHDGTLSASAGAGNGCHADFSSMDADGFTIDSTGQSVNSTQTYWLAFAFGTPAAGGITAEATPGTLTLTGASADQVITTNLSLDATPGTLTLTGTTADQVITETGAVAYEGTPGTLTLAGQAGDVVITTNLSLEAQPGAVTLTGQAADVQTGVFINADATPGAIALTGQAATVDITTALTLEATSGTLTLSGQQADVLGLVAPAIARPSVGGIKSRYRRYKRKTVIIGKKRYQVTSPEEEAMLVRRYIDELKAEREAVQTEPAEAKKVTRRLKLAATRLRKLDVDPSEHLRKLDDELLSMLGGVPWL